MQYKEFQRNTDVDIVHNQAAVLYLLLVWRLLNGVGWGGRRKRGEGGGGKKERGRREEEGGGRRGRVGG